MLKSRTMTLLSHLAPSPLYHALVPSPAPQRWATRPPRLYRLWSPIPRIQTLNIWPCQVRPLVHNNPWMTDKQISEVDLLFLSTLDCCHLFCNMVFSHNCAVHHYSCHEYIYYNHFTPSPTAEYTYGGHGGWGGASYPSHQAASSSQGHFSER